MSNILFAKHNMIIFVSIVVINTILSISIFIYVSVFLQIINKQARDWNL